jgi:hypothetical protein
MRSKFLVENGSGKSRFEDLDIMERMILKRSVDIHGVAL